MHWRLLHTPPLGGVDNMAIDETLLERARGEGEVVVRVYTWSEPTLSFGRHQTAVGAYDGDRARERGVAVVRRLTGGRAVLHHREVTYSVTAPAAFGAGLRESYDRINRLLLGALAHLGVEAELAPARGRMPPPAAAPCFELPAPGEVVVRGRKLVGSAQYRDDGALLQHGSILIDDDQSLVAELARQPVAVAPAATLRDALGAAPAVADVAGALFDAVRRQEDPAADPLDLDDILADSLARARERYLDDRWTWRR
jgi:lipoyl(octanoyl) transferase